MKEQKITLPDYKSAPPVGGSTWAWLYFFFKPLSATYWLCCLVNLMRQTFFRAQPFFFGLLVGWVESGALKDDPILLFKWIIMYGGLSLIAFYSILYVLQASGAAMDKIAKHMSLFAFRHYLNLSESWHENRASGEKLQRLLKARDSVFLLLEDTIWHVIQFPAIMLAVSISVISLGAEWYYIFMFFGMVVTYLVVSYKTGNWLKTPYEDFYKTQENVVGGVYEFLISTSTVRFFNLRNHVLDKAGDLEAINHDKAKRIFRAASWRWPALNTAMLAWILMIITASTYDVLHDRMGVAAFTAIIFLTANIWAELEIFARLYAQMIDRWEGFKRLTEVLNQTPMIEDAKDAKILNAPNASITFDKASFRYQEQAAVISDLSLHIQAGEKIGLMGPSGAGKSTLIKLILRFYDVDEGVVKIDEQDVKSLTRESIQHHIAVIPQDVVLFNHSLMENIRYGRLDASDEDVIEAAKQAHAYDFIQDLPDQFDTLVGERGVKLSGGQRQRIAIARAILKDAPILILDEATSALDSESEKLLQTSLETLMDGKTVIAVAHRLSTINQLDRLIVMDQGQIVEDGTHEALLQKDGLYAKLWSMQSGGFLKE